MKQYQARWAYATSDRAIELGFADVGCWYIGAFVAQDKPLACVSVGIPSQENAESMAATLNDRHYLRSELWPADFKKL